MSDQLDLFGPKPPAPSKPEFVFGPKPYELYDGTPPHEAAGTSVEAAERISGGVNGLRRRALDAIEASPYGLTDEQGIERTGMAANTWRPRRRELELLGRIRHEGTRLTQSGRRAKVWVKA